MYEILIAWRGALHSTLMRAYNANCLWATCATEVEYQSRLRQLGEYASQRRRSGEWIRHEITVRRVS